MLAFYAQIKAVHVLAVLSSGGLFLTRGLLVLAGHSRLAMAAPVRFASYGIDTVLLTAALMLVSIVPAAMLANHWLSFKLALLVGYVALGTLALRRGATSQVRQWCFVGALTLYVVMIGIARAHHPLGWFRTLLG